MDVRDVRQRKRRFQGAKVILLDTHAALWLLGGNRRAESLVASEKPLFLSPVSLLEFRFLIEAGKLRIAERDWEERLSRDRRFRIDDCRVGDIVTGAADLGFTRDPFDRLIAGHAIARGYRLATADDLLLEHLPRTRVFPL
jgi:PIN domain nuclease of toxin-antitoxin system